MHIKRAGSAVSLVLAFFGVVATWLTSTMPYEFMIGEIQGGIPVTICNLPEAIDDARDVYAPLCGLLITPLVVFGLVRLLRTKRLNFQIFLGLLLIIVWVYRFFLRTIFC